MHRLHSLIPGRRFLRGTRGTRSTRSTRSTRAAVGRTLLLAALLAGCTGEPVGPTFEGATSLPVQLSGGVFATVELERVGRAGAQDTLVARATLENRLAVPVRVVHGACSLDLHGWLGNGASTGTVTGAPPRDPDWRSERRLPWDGASLHGCIRIAYIAEIAPGARYTHDGLSLRTPILELLGDSLPDGRYTIAGMVGVAVVTVDSHTETWTPLPTGVAAIELAVARPPLRSQRAFNLVTWTAEPVRVSDGGLEAAVAADLTHASAMLLDLSADCALRLHVYADRASRDAAPRGGPALLRHPGSCGAETRSVLLERGRPERLTLSLAAGGAPQLAAGVTYWFAVSVHTAQGQVWLDAGSAAAP